MTGEADLSAWQNKNCPHVGCADRVYQKQLKDELERKTNEYNELHKKIVEMEELLNRKSEEGGEKELDNIISENLKLRREAGYLKNKTVQLDKDKDVLKAQLRETEIETQVRERQDRDTIKKLHNIDEDKETKEQQLEKVNEELTFIQNKNAAMREVLASLRKQYLNLNTDVEKEKNVYKKYKKDADFYRKEGVHYKAYFTRKTKRFTKRVKRIKKLYMKNPEKAKQKFSKVKVDYGELNKGERSIIAKEFVEMDKLVGE